MAWAPFAVMAASMIYDQINKKDSMNKVDTMSKGQKGILKQLEQMISPQGQLGQANQQGINYQQQLMDPSSEAVNQFAQPYINQYHQQTIPGLAERFAGYGGMGGGISSSGFGQSLGAAGANLQAQLAQLKAGLGQQAANSLMNQYSQMQGTALNSQPFGYQQRGPSMTGSAVQGWAQGGFSGAQQSWDSFKGMFGGGGTQNPSNPYASAMSPMYQTGSLS